MDGRLVYGGCGIGDAEYGSLPAIGGISYLLKIRNIQAKVGGVWTTIATVYVKVSGAWNESGLQAKSGGAWNLIHEK
jgi:Flp pilus assembly pilin Flp